MWPDNDTDLDFLHFGGVAGTVAEIITQAQGRPISIGVSGSWGAGKSSMIRLVRNALVERAAKEPSSFVFVEFNAWLYQGYDDARAALMEVIASALRKKPRNVTQGSTRPRTFFDESSGSVWRRWPAPSLPQPQAYRRWLWPGRRSAS
jgi:predicted KAP-like P-loop ATPase